MMFCSVRVVVIDLYDVLQMTKSTNIYLMTSCMCTIEDRRIDHLVLFGQRPYVDCSMRTVYYRRDVRLFVSKSKRRRGRSILESLQRVRTASDTRHDALLEVDSQFVALLRCS